MQQEETSPTAGSFNNRNAECLGEGGVEEDVSLHKYPPHLRVLQCPQKADSILQLVLLTHLLQEDSLGAIST